jgi:hypothetical protein
VLQAQCEDTLDGVSAGSDAASDDEHGHKLPTRAERRAGDATSRQRISVPADVDRLDLVGLPSSSTHRGWTALARLPCAAPRLTMRVQFASPARSSPPSGRQLSAVRVGTRPGGRPIHGG